MGLIWRIYENKIKIRLSDTLRDGEYSKVPFPKRYIYFFMKNRCKIVRMMICVISLTSIQIGCRPIQHIHVQYNN